MSEERNIQELIERLRDPQLFGTPTTIAAADALASLSLQLAAVEKKPINLGITKEWFEKQAAKEGDMEIGAGRLPEYIPGFIPSDADRYYNRQLSAAITRAETAEASLSAAKAENDRLRKALADMLPPKLDWREADADGYYVHHKASAIRDARAALSTLSKEDKPDAKRI